MLEERKKSGLEKGRRKEGEGQGEGRRRRRRRSISKGWISEGWRIRTTDQCPLLLVTS